MNTINPKLTALQDEVKSLKSSEMDRMRKEVSFLKALQTRRGLSSSHLISRDECVAYANVGIAAFIEGD